MYPDTTHIYYVKGSPGAYCLQVDPTEFGESGAGRVAYIYDLTDLVSGGSYTFSFHLLSHDEVLNNLNINFMESVFYSGFEKYNGIMMIGLCSYNSNNDTLEGIEDCYIHIDKTNYLDYFGSNTKISFEIGNVVNPCIAISYFDIRDYYSTTPMYYYFNNVSLIDNELAKEEGFLAKLFEWFQEKFDSIGDSFTNLGNKLTDLKDGFINKITDLKTSFENKITDLKESFQAKIDELKQGLIDLKDNLIEGIKSLFVPDEQAILDWKESLNTLLKDHLGIIYTCSELLTDTLNLAFDIIFDAPDTYEIKIPEVSFEAAGTTVPVFSAQNIDFSFMEKPVFKTMYSMYTVALYIFFGGLEVKYALAVYRKVMNN